MRNYAENEELCGIVRRTENCAISHSPHLNVASVPNQSLTFNVLYYNEVMKNIARHHFQTRVVRKRHTIPVFHPKS